MSGIIYVTQNLVNEKIYVGIHTLDQKDYLGSGKYLLRAITKYGRDSFRRIDVDEFDSIEEGCCKERIWIRELNSKVPTGYNLCDGGEGVFNPCQESRDKNGVAHRGDKNPMKRLDVVAKVRKTLMGNTNAKGNRNHLGKYHSEVSKAKISAHNGMKRPEVAAKHGTMLRGKSNLSIERQILVFSTSKGTRPKETKFGII